MRVTIGATLAAAISILTPVASATGATWVPDAGVTLAAGTLAEACRSAELAAAAGVPWGSFGVGWGRLEPQPDSYRTAGQPGAAAWAELGEKLKCIKATGLSVEIRITDAPDWASGRAGVGNDPPTPESVPAFADFMRDLATTYGGMFGSFHGE